MVQVFPTIIRRGPYLDKNNEYGYFFLGLEGSNSLLDSFTDSWKSFVQSCQLPVGEDCLGFGRFECRIRPGEMVSICLLCIRCRTLDHIFRFWCREPRWDILFRYPWLFRNWLLVLWVGNEYLKNEVLLRRATEVEMSKNWSIIDPQSTKIYFQQIPNTMILPLIFLNQFTSNSDKTCMSNWDFLLHKNHYLDVWILISASASIVKSSFKKYQLNSLYMICNQILVFYNILGMYVFI